MPRFPGHRAKDREKAARKVTARKLPWERKGLSRVERILAFLEFLPITKGKFSGRKLELLPIQRRFIERVYSESGDNRTRVGVLSMPRGNGKTGLVAGLTLCHFLGPEAEFRGECYSAAIDRNQAGLIANEMEAIIQAVPEFAARVAMRKWPYRSMTVVEGDGIGSVYQALSADGRRGHGLAPNFWVYDELAQAKDRQLLDALTTAMGKRKRSLGIVISTQAADDEHPLSQLIDLGRRNIDPSITVDLLTAPVDADPFDSEVIRSVNPAFGKFLDEADILAEAKRAREMPSFESAFRNLRLNQRIRVAGEEMFLTPEVWARNAGPVDHALFTSGRPVFGGFDLSGKIDLTALVLACRDDDGNVHLMPTAWTPGDTVLERTRRDRAQYDAWVRGGFLRTTPGPAIDLDWLAAEIAEIVAPMNLVSIDFDEWNMRNLKQAFDRIGFTPPLNPFRQGFKSFGPAVTDFEALAVEGRLRHGGHPVFDWCIGNTTMLKDPALNRKPDKAQSFGRIDLAVAAMMAVSALASDTSSGEFDAESLIMIA